eukprot:11810215-Alexandrium_andersonii.AAC.1
MSASLVGSEMCIRDRLLSFLRHRASALSQAECAALGVQIHLAVQAAARSVSYTHLTLPTICSV